MKAFQHVASDDFAVSEWLRKQSAGGNACAVISVLITLV